jgi:signal transduction histidine kinase
VSWAMAFVGWALAVALACSMRRRLSLVADAEHELRGAAAAIGLAAERMPRGDSAAAVVRLQADRLAAGLSDLATARSRRARPVGHPRFDSGRLAQVLGNLAANAAEHGVGPVDVRTARSPGALRIEVRNRNRPPELDPAGGPGRGRGLAIAERASRQLGGRLSVESDDGETTAELVLPVPEAAPGHPPWGEGQTLTPGGRRPAA